MIPLSWNPTDSKSTYEASELSCSRIICPTTHWPRVISFSVYVPGCGKTMWLSYIFEDQVPTEQITAVT